MVILSVVYKAFLFFSFFGFVEQRDNFTIVIKATKHITVVRVKHVPGSPHSFLRVIIVIELGHT